MLCPLILLYFKLRVELGHDEYTYTPRLCAYILEEINFRIASLSFILHSGLACVGDSSTTGIYKRGKKSKVYMGMLY